MILINVAGGNEAHPVYQALAAANGRRQGDFLRSIVEASLALRRSQLSLHVLKALNFHALACLHPNAGEYRQCPAVSVEGTHLFPDHHRVPALIEDFVDTVNRVWGESDPVELAAYVLWGVNAIHPFINGNGRTARAACYFVLCLKSGRWLPGDTALPELLARDRTDYLTALQAAHSSLAGGALDLSQVRALLTKLLQEQMASAQ